MSYRCKDCQGTLNFPENLTKIQAHLHKRAFPKHNVVMVLPANPNIQIRQEK